MSVQWPPPQLPFGTAGPATVLTPAPPGRRLCACLIDSLIPVVNLSVFGLAFMNVISMLPNSSGEQTGETVGNPLGLFLLALCFIAGITVLWFVLIKRGTSPGKKLLGLYVVDAGSGVTADSGRMFLRENICKGLLCLVLWGVPAIVGLVMVFIHPKRSTPWDLMTHTMVVRRK